MDFINLSGGIGIPYQADDTPNDIFAIAEGVKAPLMNSWYLPASTPAKSSLSWYVAFFTSSTRTKTTPE